MGEELVTTVHQNMGEELGNYVHQNTCPEPPCHPDRVSGHTQTDSNITVHTDTDPPRSSFGTDTHTQ